jgi:hypothetical protein
VLFRSDPFEFEGIEYFQYYDASTAVWMIGEAIKPADRVYWDFSTDASSDDKPEDFAAANALSFMPPPSLPEVLEGQSYRGPFWHGERQFFWLLSDLQEGWHLALLLHGTENTGVFRLFYRENARVRSNAGLVGHAAEPLLTAH